jgi:hypothetical protein
MRATRARDRAVKIVEGAVPAVRSELAERTGIARRSAVAAVIGCVDGEAGRGQRAREPCVARRMLAESVRDNDDSARRRRRKPGLECDG